MARSRYELTETKIAKFLRERRGQGEHADYRPWLTVQDVPSRGRCHRIFCDKSGRTIHLLSDIEKRVFTAAWWREETVDLREQFPLDREKTRWIAARLGVRHPRDPKTGVDIVMTTDVLATVRTSRGIEYHATSAKHGDDLKTLRTKEKQLIEKIYWGESNFKIHTPAKDMPVYRNLDWIFSADGAAAHVERHPAFEETLLALRAIIGRDGQTVNQACMRVNDQMGGSICATSVLRRAIYRRLIAVDLHAWYLPMGPSRALGNKT